MKKLTSIAAFAALTAFAGAASAQAYIGGTVGVSNFSVDCLPGASCDTTDTAFKIYGGYTVAPHVSIEAAYIDFGTTSINGGPFTLGAIDVSAFVINAAYHWDFSPKWTGVARLGLANVSTDPSGIAGNNSDSAIKLYGGLGIEYALSKNFKIVGAFDLTSFEVRGSSGSLNAVSGGIQFSF